MNGRLPRRPLRLAAAVLIGLCLSAVACEASPPGPEEPPVPQMTSSAAFGENSGQPLPPDPGEENETDVLFPLLLEQPYAFPGLYQSAGMSIYGDDQFALVASSMPCAELASAIAAGEWQAHVEVSFPSLDPEGGPPSGVWLYLERGGESLVARLGGEEYCGGRLTRSSIVSVAGSGTHNFSGEAKLMQDACFVGAGGAQLQLTYYGPDDVRLSVSLSLPVATGRNVADDLEVVLARSTLTPRDYYEELAAAVARGQLQDVDIGPTGMELLAVEAPVVEIESIEPLVGRLTAELQSERGEDQSLDLGFRCDAAAGQLAEAAEQAVDRPGPATPEPPAAAGQLTLDVASGRHAGQHTVSSSELYCSYNLFSDGAWMASYVAEDETEPGELSSLQLTVREDGTASVLALLGEDFDEDWLDTEQASGEVFERNGLTQLLARGSSRTGVGFELAVSCAEVAQF